jgi:uncharacterized protein YjbJ (UPF0337 family)
MDKDRVEGKVKDIAGRAQRQAGEWTGDSDAQAEGAEKQVEGKIQHAFGKAQDAVKSAKHQIKKDREPERTHDRKDERVA